MSKPRLIIDHDFEALFERRLLDDIIFFGSHPFNDVWYSTTCGFCGEPWTHPMHDGVESGIY